MSAGYSLFSDRVRPGLRIPGAADVPEAARCKITAFAGALPR